MERLRILEAGQTGKGVLIEHTGQLRASAQNTSLQEAPAEGKPQVIRYVDALLQKADTLNKNGRIYPYNILKKQVDIYMEQVNGNSAVGEADHPDSSVISLQNEFSHIIKSIWWEDKTVWGTLELVLSDLYMQQGKIQLMGDRISEYLKRGIKLGISSRGIGSVKEQAGKFIVQEDFELICWDLVHTPSTPDAYLVKGYTQKPADRENRPAQNPAPEAQKGHDEDKYMDILKNFLKK